MTLVPPRRAMHMVFGAIDKVAALLGATEPLHWLTIDSNSSIVALYEVDGRTYTLDIHPSKRGQASETRVPVRGTLTTRRTDTEVTLTEVTDPAVKHQVVIAYVAQRPRLTMEIATGEHKHLKGQSMLVILGLAKDDSPEGLASAVPHVAVFEVTAS
jgi:hypothetical protein